MDVCVGGEGVISRFLVQLMSLETGRELSNNYDIIIVSYVKAPSHQTSCHYVLPRPRRS